MQKGMKCKFYREGQPNSCKNEAKCMFVHDKTYTIKSKQPPTQEYLKIYSQGGQKEITDPQVWDKLKYLSFMKDQLKQKCKRCGQMRHLVITGCGCQVQCEQCATKGLRCLECGCLYNEKFLIKTVDKKQE